MSLWLFVLTVGIAAEILTLGLNTLQSLLWFGHVSTELLVIGTIDALVVSVIVGPFCFRLLRLRETNERLQREIAERSRVEEALRGAQAELEGRVAGRTLELARANEALRESEERYRTLVENQGEGVGILDGEGRFLFVNPAGHEILGVAQGALVARRLEEFVDAEGVALLEAQRAHHRADRTTVYEIAILRPDGGRRSLLVTARPRLDGARRLAGTFVIFRDHTERRRTEEQLRYLGTHDPLTGLYNRAYFEDELARLERGRQYPVSAVMVDVDGLKRVNDTRGHAAGDELLRRTAAVLRASFRLEDVVARIGGDEFAVLLPGTGAQSAGQAVARVRATVLAHNAGHEGTTLSLSLGLGTAEQREDLAGALKMADDLMFADKAARRIQRTAGIAEPGGDPPTASASR